MIFYRESEIRRAVKDMRLELTGGHTGGSGGHAFVSDPTAVQGVSMAMELKHVTLYDGTVIRHPERWLRVIDGTLDYLSELEMRVIKRKYSNEIYKKTCDDFNISPHMYYAIINKARSFAIAAACQLGLVRVI